jgi:hypothetical protein
VLLRAAAAKRRIVNRNAFETILRNPVSGPGDGKLIDGRSQLKAIRKLGMAEIPVMECDEWTPAQVKHSEFWLTARQREPIGMRNCRRRNWPKSSK